MAKSAQQATNNWKAGMQAPTTAQRYKDGINSYQGNPMQAAASQADYWAQQVVNSKQRYIDKLNATPVDRWRTNATTMGATALTTGATKGASKYQDYANKFQGVWQQASQAAKSLPKGGKANALARISASMDVMMQAAGKG